MRIFVCWRCVVFGVEVLVMELLFSVLESSIVVSVVGIEYGESTIIRCWCWGIGFPVRFRFAFVGGFEVVFRLLKGGSFVFGVGWTR